MVKFITSIYMALVALFSGDREIQQSVSPVQKEEVMRISNAGINLIKESESLKLARYNDPVGVPTIGYGHTGYGTKQEKITEEKAEELLRGDLSDAEDAVRQLVKVELTQNQFDSLVSFVFNLGRENFARSTLLKRLNNGNYYGASKEFPKWRLAKGKVLNGLVKRREKERQLFIA